MNHMLESIRIPQIRPFCESKQSKCASKVAQYCDLALKNPQTGESGDRREPMPGIGGMKPGQGVREQAVSHFGGHQTRLSPKLGHSKRTCVVENA